MRRCSWGWSSTTADPTCQPGLNTGCSRYEKVSDDHDTGISATGVLLLGRAGCTPIWYGRAVAVVGRHRRVGHDRLCKARAPLNRVNRERAGVPVIEDAH